METKFFNLKQGNMLVAVYEHKFSQMSMYAPHQVHTEAKKDQRFRYGMRSKFRNIVSGQGITTLAKTFERAEEIAASIAMDTPKSKVGYFSRKMKWDGATQNRNLNFSKQGRVAKDATHIG
ncbi:hypothetical protein ACS0TY_013897 [Phlomoides rotata]